jgi:thioredoxin-dependent peroxiredoxin
LSVRLLADEESEVCAKYGVLQQKEVDGVRRPAVSRSTFVIDRSGVLQHVLYGVKATGHAAEVLELVRGLDE